MYHLYFITGDVVRHTSVRRNNYIRKVGTFFALLADMTAEFNYLLARKLTLLQNKNYLDEYVRNDSTNGNESETVY